MTEPQSHYVRRSIFEIALRGASDAARLREKAGAAWESAILPELDRVFSEVGSPDCVQRIGRIEIDLGEIAEDELEGNIGRKIASLVRSRLLELTASTAVADKGGLTVLSGDELDLELLHVFLATGMLPAWASETAGRTVPQTVMARLLDRGYDIRNFLESVIADDIQRQRLIAQFSNELLWAVIGTLWTAVDVREGRRLMEAEISKAAEAGISRETWRALFWDSLLRLYGRDAAAEPGVDPVSVALNAAVARRRAAEPAVAPEQDRPACKLAARREAAERQAVENGICVGNAGLVLLWPYLERFFVAVGLVDRGSFRDEAGAARAVHLLQYVVDGREDAPEHELPLNKLLCGWDIWRPVPRRVELTECETTEARRLLEVLIGHWTALRNTSVDGLRKAFLQRNGLIARDGAEWLLRVERKGHDVLLERLPWPVSPVVLPWTKRMMLVEW